MNEIPTFESIMARMLENVPSDVDKREGSVIYDALAPCAVELINMYIELLEVREDGFADSASRPFLIRRAAERQISPYPATAAILKGQFLPTSLDVTGERFSLEKLNYIVTERCPESDGEGMWYVRCETPGADGNRLLGDLVPCRYVSGLASAALTAVSVYGEDEEDTEAFRKRYFETFNAPFPGNKADYKARISAMDGIGGVKVVPKTEPDDEIEVYIESANFTAVSDELLKKVQNDVDPGVTGMGEGLAPIGHKVRIYSVTEVPVTVSVGLVYDTGKGFGDVKDGIESALSEYFAVLSQKWEDKENIVLQYFEAASRVIDVPGVKDMTSLSLSAEGHTVTANGNLPLGAYEIPKVTAISAATE